MNRKEYTHISFGNFNIDIVLYLDNFLKPGDTILSSDIDIRPGGAATNYAVNVAQYGHRVYLVASISNHPVTRDLLNQIREKGVILDYVKYVNRSPGIVTILVSPGGERSMVKYTGANRELSAEDIPVDLIKKTHVVHMASIHPKLANSICKRTIGGNTILTYDPGVYVGEVVNSDLDFFKYIDILFVNENEYNYITSKLKNNTLFKYGLSLLVIKMGRRGASAMTPSGICYRAMVEPVKKPVDTTGAGDAFNALFNARYLESKDIASALAYGVAAGALKTGFKSSFLILDEKLFEIQLGKVVVEKTTCDL